MGNLGECVNIRNVAAGVAQCFNVDGFCIGLDGSLDFLKVMNVNKGCVDPEKGKGVGKKICRAAMRSAVKKLPKK